MLSKPIYSFLFKSQLIFKPIFFKSYSTIRPLAPKFIFDSNGKTVIFLHRNGESELRWLIRGLVLFTMLNTFLLVSEYIKPVFGGWNGISFLLTTGLGIGSLIFLNIISKRVIREIKLFRTGDFVEINFFNAFWIPQKKIFHISEFSHLEPSYFIYYRTEVTSLGNAWISLEKNSYEGDVDYEEIINDVLNGRIIKMNNLEQKVKKYQKYH